MLWIVTGVAVCQLCTDAVGLQMHGSVESKLSLGTDAALALLL